MTKGAKRTKSRKKTRTTPTSLTTPKGRGLGKKKKPREDRETGYSSAYAQLLGVLSEGPIEGPIGGLQGVYLNETPVQNKADGTLNFNSVGYDFRNGSSEQPPITGIGDDITSETSLGIEVKYDQAITRFLRNPNLDLIRVRLAFQMQEFNPDGGYRRVDMHFRISIKEGSGGFVNRYEQVLNARFSSPVELEYDFPVNNYGGTVNAFAVRVERLTPTDSNLNRWQRVMTFKAFAEVVAARLTYPFSALAAMTFYTAQFDTLPQAAFKIGGRLIQIPTNATVGTDRGLDYSGTWDGTFYEAPIACSCPAWIFYDLVTNTRYGLGRYVKPENINKWSLYELSKYCNEFLPIPEVYNGHERRFACHVLLENKEDATKVIDAIRSIFRGFTYWMNGTVNIAADRPGTPAMIVTQADIENGMFSYSRTALRDRHTVAHVTWLDPDNFYKRAIETVEDFVGIDRYGIREIEISAFGCVSRYQAHRVGWATILSERLEVEIVKFRLRPYGAYCVPGMIIKTMDIKRSIVRFGGLVLNCTNTQITLDYPVSLSGEVYTLSLMLPDGSLIERTVNETYGTINQLTFSYIADPPICESPWILSSSTVLPGLYRIIGVVPVQGEENLLYEISALEYVDAKYNVIDTDYYVPVAPPRPLPPPVVPKPENVVGTLDDNYSRTAWILGVTWTKPASDFILGYYVEYSLPGGEWVGTQQVQFTSASWDVTPSLYYARVATIDVNNNTSNWVEIGPIDIKREIHMNLVVGGALTDINGIAMHLGLHFALPSVRKFRTPIATPQGSAALTRIQQNLVNDGYVAVSDIGFDFFFFLGTNYRYTLYVGSNSYVTFGFGSTVSYSLSATNPGRGLLIAAGDRSYTNVWAGQENDTFRIRFEGNTWAAGTPGTPIVWELTLFPDNVMQLVTGTIPTQPDGVSLLSNGAFGLTYAIASNSSWVFQPSGATYTIQQGSYS